MHGRFSTTARDGQALMRAKWADLLDWKLDKGTDVPIYQQVANFLRVNIVSGLLPPGSRLPSSRELVNRLGVSRTTIINAYSQLLADGYIVGHIGSGTYVAYDTPDHVDQSALAAVAQHANPDTGGMSEKGQRYKEINLGHFVMENVPFNTGVVRVDGRTSAQWRQLASRRLAIDPQQLGYIDPMGESALRREIAKYLLIARGVRCTADQIVLVAGTQQAIDLTIKVLLDPGSSVWVEDPGYPLTSLALVTAGMKLVPVPVDDEGMRVSDGVLACPAARAAFVTPSHQYPLGVSLSLKRREELLKWAARTNSWIVEDDYDAEFRYEGAPLPALKALDGDSRVLYVGSFSKVLFPGLRYGYMVVPPTLVGAFAAARFLSDRHPAVFLGGVLAEFMERGFFVTHIRRMRNEYRAAREILAGLLQRHLGHVLDVTMPDQGMHMIAYLRGGLSDKKVAEEARKNGVIVRPISQLYRHVTPRSGLMLGFAGFDEHRLRSAVVRLRDVLEKMVGPEPSPR